MARIGHVWTIPLTPESYLVFVASTSKDDQVFNASAVDALEESRLRRRLNMDFALKEKPSHRARSFGKRKLSSLSESQQRLSKFFVNEAFAATSNAWSSLENDPSVWYRIDEDCTNHRPLRTTRITLHAISQSLHLSTFRHNTIRHCTSSNVLQTHGAEELYPVR